ncbi:MAG: phosphate signaling complex protein PhoU [Pseudomonadota bacterium]
MDQQDLGHHISRQFDEDLSALRHRVLHMGGMVEAQVERSLRALSDGDERLAAEVCADDRKINRMEVVLDEECRRILALRQPAASDLRLVVATLKTVTDLERIGDEAQKISEAAARLSEIDRNGPVFDRLQSLGRQVMTMVSGVLDAFARLDARHAISIARMDSAIDAQHFTIREDATAAMMELPAAVPMHLDAIWASRSLERIGDHVHNVCEHVIFMVYGQDVRHSELADLDLALAASGAGDDPSVDGPPQGSRQSPLPTA